MKVLLKRNAFLGGCRYRSGRGAVDIPDDPPPVLPCDAVVVGCGGEPADGGSSDDERAPPHRRPGRQ